MNRLHSLPFVLLAAACAPAAAQQPAQQTSARAMTVPAANAAVRKAIDAIKADNAWTLDQQVSICEIPAPPFKEERRAAEYAKRLTAVGLTNVRTDAIGNVIGELRGTGSGPTVMIAAHLDTVFPESTDVTVKKEGTLYRGPGIGDDCRGLAVVLAVAKAFVQSQVRPTGTILFVGNVGEEGPGNLRGVRHLFTKEMPGKIDYFISVDGTGLDVTSRAVGSNRYRVTYEGPGGHSYGAFGMPNPVHALGRAIAKISDLQTPREPRTTFSVGIVTGGTSVNTISPSAAMDVDMRSEDPASLARLDSAFQVAIASALQEERARWPGARAPLNMKVDTIGIRPAGAQPDTAPIVRAAIDAGKALGISPQTSASSTDANLPMSLGIPAITIDGGGRGRGAHSTAESYDDGDRGWLGPQWAALIVATLAGVR